MKRIITYGTAGVITGVAVGIIIGHVYLGVDYILWWEQR